MRFPNHELVVGPPPVPWWSLHAVSTFEAHDPADQKGADVLCELMAKKMDEAVSNFGDFIENMMFWEPAREALENGGCRQ